MEITEFSIKKKHSDKRIKIIQRLILGYSGFCSQSGLFSGIYSEKAKAVSKTSKEITADHVFGATMIGEEIIKKFKSKKFDINYMTNTWLYENLFLWMTIKITKLEHNKLSKDNTFDEKKAMKHYQDAKIFNIYYKD